jgi:hypothetical protein
MSLPYLLPWVRVLLLIRSITSTTWGHEAWPEVKPVLRRALQISEAATSKGADRPCSSGAYPRAWSAPRPAYAP